MKNKIRARTMCPKCLKEMSASSINEHIKMVHDRIYDVFCTKCDQSFTRTSDLNRHDKCVHSGIKVHCGKSLSNNDSSHGHVKTVRAGTKRTMCHICMKEVTRIKEHIKLVHLKIYDVFCAQCNKSFTRNSELNAHVKRVHDKVHDASCTYCLKGFTTSSELNVHVKQVHDKIYDISCTQCNKRYSRTSHLNAHVKRAHNKIEKETDSKGNCPKNCKKIPSNRRRIRTDQNLKMKHEGDDMTCRLIQVESGKLINCKTEDESVGVKTVLGIKESAIRIVSDTYERSSFACPVLDCDSSFEHFGRLNDHLVALHNFS